MEEIPSYINSNKLPINQGFYQWKKISKWSLGGVIICLEIFQWEILHVHNLMTKKETQDELKGHGKRKVRFERKLLNKMDNQHSTVPT